MTDALTTDERTQALALANRLLDEPNCDPDDDLRVLSRHLIRCREQSTKFREALYKIACDNEPWDRDAMIELAYDTIFPDLKK